jgi:hypothetical protein
METIRMSLKERNLARRYSLATEVGNKFGAGIWSTGAKFAAIFAFIILPAAAFAQDSLQINVPYHCANGITYTILECKPYGNGQMCTWREEQNGQIVVTANSLRSQMSGRLQGCTVGAAPKNAAPQAGGSQNLNPPYMKEFPTVDQVLSKLKGSDAADTINRQLGAFREFKQFIEDLAGTRWYKNQLTADEKRIYGEYDLAYNKIAQPLNFPLDGYFGRGPFIATLFTTFSMTEVRALWDKQNAEFNARHAPPPAGGGAQPTPGAPQQMTGLPPTNDPTALATRRCLELGGGALECVGSGFSTGLQSWIGVNLDAIKPPGATGLRMTGVYKSSSGFALTFGDDAVSIDNCGKLVSSSHKYTVQKVLNQFAIKIDNQPQALLIALGPDGRIAAPAVVDIAGQIIVGYDTTLVETKDLTTGQIVPGSAHYVQTPRYGPKTERCSIGTMNPGPAAPPDKGLMSSIIDVASMLFSDGSPQSQQGWISPGPRFLGTYTSTGGLKMQFQSSSAILDCAQAHVAALYQVSNTAGGVAITVKNGSTPFTLMLQSNGSITGPGSVTINGRLLMGMNGDTPVFNPTSASCAASSVGPAK